ncbi:hypothetical protein BSLG_010383 [Batrachochytrium salamandrivorans]|nr:hypothetical protein BSLG_010383 [Batrachochytrium salamandrivorans]
MKAAAFATLTLLASAVCAAPPNEEYSRGPYGTLRSSRNGGSFRQPRNSRSTLTQTWTPGTAYAGLNTNQRGRSGEHESHDGYETGSSTKTSTDAMIKSLPQVRKGAGEEYVTGALSTCDIIIARIVDASGLSLVELEAEYVPGKGDSETENANKLMFDDTKGKIKLVEERKKLILKSARVNKGN